MCLNEIFPVYIQVLPALNVISQVKYVVWGKVKSDVLSLSIHLTKIQILIKFANVYTVLSISQMAWNIMCQDLGGTIQAKWLNLLIKYVPWMWHKSYSITLYIFSVPVSAPWILKLCLLGNPHLKSVNLFLCGLKPTNPNVCYWKLIMYSCFCFPD